MDAAASIVRTGAPDLPQVIAVATFATGMIVSQGGGDKVDNAMDGLRAIAAGKKVDYDGASGPCDFTDAGDITDCQFRYDQVRGGQLTLIRVA